jgi:predicted RNase H-like HicB family nuclease
MNFPIVIHKERGSDYGVTVPDLPGCFSAGRTLDEALAMAREAIELHIEGLIDEGQPIPAPAKIEAHQNDPDYANGTWAIVGIDQSKLRIRAKRINITMPERTLDAVDRYAERHGETRSGLLVRAAMDYIGRDSIAPRSSADRPKKQSRSHRPRK